MTLVDIGILLQRVNEAKHRPTHDKLNDTAVPRVGTVHTREEQNASPFFMRRSL
jgi:hypothetical protein